MNKFVFFSLKAYGDFLIQYTSICKWAPDPEDITIVASVHLKSLYDVISKLYEKRPTVIFGEYSAVHGVLPEVYDLRKKGLLRFLYSLIKVYGIRKILSNDAVLVYDKIGFRERFISLGYNRVQLGRSDNIYFAYESFFSKSAEISDATTATNISLSILIDNYRNIKIFPESRVESKKIPSDICNQIQLKAKNGNVHCQTITMFEYGTEYENSKRVPQEFETLFNEVSEADFVIAADSLPGHVAYVMSKPVFVINRKANTYWLPRSAFQGNAWCTFENFDLTRRTIA